MILKKRGQAATETTILLGVLLIIILSILSLSSDVMGTISGSHSSSKVRNMADQVVSSSTFVYSQGEGARTVLYLEIPKEVTKVNLTGNLMEIDVNIKGKEETIYRKTDYILNGTLPDEPGRYCLSFDSNEGYVEVSRYLGNC